MTAPMAAGDPGKDLFAYLFLLMMIFAFMLLMSFESSGRPQQAPDQKKSAVSGYAVVSAKNIATLEKKNGRLMLRFEDRLYDPRKDIERLEADGRIVSQGRAELEKKMLYIKKTQQTQVSLYDYLETFKTFSDNRIYIAFASEVK